MKRFVLFFILPAAILMFGAAQTTRQINLQGTISPALQEILDNLQPGDMTTVIVQLAAHANLENLPGQGQGRLAGIIRALQATAEASQAPLRAFLRQQQALGNVSEFTPFWVVNGLSVNATGEAILEMAARGASLPTRSTSCRHPPYRDRSSPT